MFGASNPFGQSSNSSSGTTQPVSGQTSNASNHPFVPKPFGSLTTPFGAQTGSSIFGGTSTGMFGTPQISSFSMTNAFGNSTPAFGVSSTPAFVASGTLAFGASSSPAFGGFGQSSLAFGSSPFGSTTSTFPVQTSPFGSQTTTSPFGNTSFAQLPYVETAEVEGEPQAGKLFSKSAMIAYKDKSHEELRWEDYQLGDEGSSPFGQKPFGGFRSTTQASLLRSTNQQSQTAFGDSLFCSTPFGAPTQSAFGAASTPAFGTTAPAFGTTSTTPAFGSTSTAPAFGSMTTPGFGSTGAAFTSSPFGTSTTSGFGASTTTPAFGNSTISGFGTPTTSAFGATSSPSFTFSSSPGFGQSTSAFGSSPFGSTTSTFPVQTSPFGAQTTTSPFGNTGFAQSGFGVQRPGTRASPYAETAEAEGGVLAGKLLSISAMTAYKDKSPEELRWEDYQLGDKGGLLPAGQSLGGGGFNVPTPQPNPFAPSTGLGQTSTNIFSSTTTNLFAPKTQTSTPSFNTTPFGPSTSSNLFQSSKIPAFSAGSSPSLFGTTSTPSFSSTPSLFSSTAGQGTVSPFGSNMFNNTQPSLSFPSTTPSLGQTTAFSQPSSFGPSTTSSLFSSPSTVGLFSSTPSLNLGGFHQLTPSQPASFQITQPPQNKGTFDLNVSQIQTGSAFGHQPVGGFGSSTQASLFGSTNQQSQPAFGSSLFCSTPLGAPTQSAFGAASTPAFGTTSTPPFDSTSTAPAKGSMVSPGFGSTGAVFTSSSLFGTGEALETSTTSGFGASTTASAFGTSTTSAFVATSSPSFMFSSSPGFGQSTPAFGSSPGSLFNSPSTCGLFSSTLSLNLGGFNQLTEKSKFASFYDEAINLHPPAILAAIPETSGVTRFCVDDIMGQLRFDFFVKCWENIRDKLVCMPIRYIPDLANELEKIFQSIEAMNINCSPIIKRVNEVIEVAKTLYFFYHFESSVSSMLRIEKRAVEIEKLADKLKGLEASEEEAVQFIATTHAEIVKRDEQLKMIFLERSKLELSLQPLEEELSNKRAIISSIQDEINMISTSFVINESNVTILQSLKELMETKQEELV